MWGARRDIGTKADMPFAGFPLPVFGVGWRRTLCARDLLGLHADNRQKFAVSYTLTALAA
jgi:hypothetical protein